MVQDKQKIEIEIESKVFQQLKVFSEYINQTVESLINKILTKEVKYYICDNFQHLNEFANDVLFFDNLINKLRELGD